MTFLQDVHEYESIFVTFPLNPLSRKGDLPSLRSKPSTIFLYSTDYKHTSGLHFPDLATQQLIR